MNSTTLDSVIAVKPRGRVIFLLIVASLALTYIPILNLLVYPIHTFVTSIHEMGHALACLATGGHVDSLTIVEDGQGHGGLTYCLGGLPFIYTQAGYMGTSIFGCLLIALGRLPRMSKFLLCGIGAALAYASVAFMFKGVLHGNIEQGLGSMFCGVLLSAFFFYAGFKLNFYWANILLLFMGVQCSLNSLNDIVIVSEQSLGMLGPGFSDATNMQTITGIPAFFWAALWGLISVSMMAATLWWSYRPKPKSITAGA